MIKTRNLFTVLLLLVMTNGFSQTITLEECKEWSHDVFPLFRSQKIYQSLLDKEQAVVHYDKYPSFVIKGQASYQSDVVSLDEPSPLFSFPEISKDQYQLFVEVNQSIYDGGVKQVKGEINILNDSICHLSFMMDLHRLDEKLEQTYCQLLLSQKQYQLHVEQLKTVARILDEVSAQVAQGKALRLQVNEIKVQQLVYEQKRDQALDQYQLLCRVMGVLSGKSIDISTASFQFPLILLSEETQTPNDIMMMNLQQQHFKEQAKLLSKSMMPTVQAFGKGGYGRPGLNFLDNSFAPYYYVGVGVSWRPFDWRNTKRKQSMQLDQVALLEVKKDQTTQLRDAHKVQLKGKIETLNHQLNKDQEIKELREAIKKDLKQQWELRTIPFSIYIDGVNNSLEAEIQKELHRIQKLETILSYNRYQKQS
ncbi:TolC family protein [Halosquirtibacter laminarini]|uniref:TolC family protein n=1 Tax=Halosquirtibacter laminarini TaxID=3374600 RepID=A0AC61NIS5_9BACT|nr:TolC family protein [Prolixibacteraceae bacterium]